VEQLILLYLEHYPICILIYLYILSITGWPAGGRPDN